MLTGMERRAPARPRTLRISMLRPGAYGRLTPLRRPAGRAPCSYRPIP